MFSASSESYKCTLDQINEVRGFQDLYANHVIADQTCEFDKFHPVRSNSQVNTGRVVQRIICLDVKKSLEDLRHFIDHSAQYSDTAPTFLLVDGEQDEIQEHEIMSLGFRKSSIRGKGQNVFCRFILSESDNKFLF